MLLEDAKARLRDCNVEAIEVAPVQVAVRRCESPLEGLQLEWKREFKTISITLEDAKARLRDCNNVMTAGK